jgi:hypothetical protein
MPHQTSSDTFETTPLTVFATLILCMALAAAVLYCRHVLMSCTTAMSCCCYVLQGGLTWLWLDAPYVITARKLFNWAVESNNKGDVFPVSALANRALWQPQLQRPGSVIATWSLWIDDCMNSAITHQPAARLQRDVQEFDSRAADFDSRAAFGSRLHRLNRPLYHYSRCMILLHCIDLFLCPADPRHLPGLPAAAHPGVQCFPQRPAH